MSAPAPPDPLHRAMIELCYELGLEEMTIAELCQHAEIERSEFDARYSNLEDCYAGTIEECAEEFLGKMKAAYAADALRWQDRLRAAAYTALLHLQEDTVRAHFTVVESINGGERTQLVRERVFATLASFLDDGRRLPSASDALSEATAQSLNGAISRHLRLGIEKLETDRFAEVLPQLMYAVVLPYVGPEAAAEELEMVPPVPVSYGPGSEVPPPLPPRKINASRSAQPYPNQS